MSIFHDEVEIEDMERIDDMFYYPCPCGDRFQISLEELQNGEEVAHCPSCTLVIRVIYDPEDFDPDVDDGVDLSIAV